MENVVVSFKEFDSMPLMSVLWTVEKTKLYAFCMLREQSEINPFAVPIGPKWVGVSWPNAQLHVSSSLRDCRIDFGFEPTLRLTKK
jgi:hypothetical protein